MQLLSHLVTAYIHTSALWLSVTSTKEGLNVRILAQMLGGPGLLHDSLSSAADVSRKWVEFQVKDSGINVHTKDPRKDLYIPAKGALAFLAYWRFCSGGIRRA